MLVGSQSDEGESQGAEHEHAGQMVGRTFCRHRYAARHAAGIAKVPDTKIIIEEAELPDIAISFRPHSVLQCRT